MKVKFLGAAGMVTGSCYLISHEGRQILLDLGLFQGGLDESRPNYEPLRFKPSELSGMVLTHAHLDHCGRLPLLVHGGFSGDIWMTEATMKLLEITLMDSANIAKENKDKPMFNEEDVIKTLSMCKTIGYHETFEVGGMSFNFLDAGHILGSASVEIKIENPKNQKIETIVFSGDLGNSPQDLIMPTEIPESADYVIMESTYGDKTHPGEDAGELLGEEIKRAEQDGGTLLIPAFSLERTQEILHKIDHLKRTKVIKNETPVYMDSPMAIKATAVFEGFKDLYNKELADHAKTDDPFEFPGLVRVQHGWESKKIKDQIGAKVIIAGSGMMTGGRIIHHAIDFLGSDSNAVLFVGFQGEETLGRKIMDGEKKVWISGVEVEIKARVREIRAMSAHADQPRLLHWISQIKGVKTAILTHGEEIPRLTLAEKIKNEVEVRDVRLPKLGEEIDFS